MCGILAVISKKKVGLFPDQMKVFEQLLLVGQLRGVDGTGVFYQGEDGRICIDKSANDSKEFLESKEWNKTYKQCYAVSSFIVGHNRAATKGATTQANTHPFKEGHITLVHNGTLFAHKELADTEVDSHAICRSMNKIGVENTLKKVNGAFALAWYDNKEKTLNFCRNTQRPLTILEYPDCFIVVSESFMGQWIAERNDIGKVTVHKTVPGEVYTFHKDDMSKMTVKKVELFSYSYPSQQSWMPYKKGDIDKDVVATNGSYSVGTRIEFSPKTLSTNKLSCVIGVFKSIFNRVPDIQVKHFAKDAVEAHKIVNKPSVSGIVAQIIYDPTVQKTTLVVRDVKDIDVFRTANNKFLSAKEIADLDCKCDVCNIILDKEDIGNMHVTNKNGVQSASCPDCTAFINNDYSHYGI